MEVLNEYSTHRPILKKYIEISNGNVLELGIGYGSTGFILDILKNTNRKLISIENDKKWIEKMKNLFPPSENHIYHYYTDYTTELNDIFTKYSETFGVVFLDSSPWMSRIAALNYFKDNKKTDYILIHDVDFYPKNNIIGTIISETSENQNEPLIDFSNVSKEYQLYYPPKPYPSPTGPPTLIFSPTGKKIFINHF